MKKLPLVATMILALVLGLTSCLSTSSASSSTTTSSNAAVKMYVNVPQNNSYLYTIAAELGFKAVDSSYNGVVLVNYTTSTSSATEAGIQITKYYGYCEAIKNTIQQDTGRTCTLTFNTQANGDGYQLDFSSVSEGLKSLLRMAVYNLTEVYAIYKY